MLEYEELKEAVDRCYIKGDKVSVVRRNGKLVDYVLPGEPVRPWEVVTVELLVDVLNELLGH
ncbi:MULTISPECIES: Paratox [unclassified Streptococcus]|uniref:competence regulator inhibitor paratox n=1 Tax=unclassified Streptococcus TaxID=2608887 RepID=UPI00211AC309|nr:MULTISPECIES: Paratox [unclassified Streptococcus]MCQ9211669.1 Paratox [Streptococcus sp. B01]MCQ9213187.1 Paratox [Streptococcus sp. O1]MCQ9215062.1 Paratox [Streptococcus sp. O1]